MLIDILTDFISFRLKKLIYSFIILFYSRKENAVVSITSACDLVKTIALGQRILKEGMSICQQ